MAPLDSYLDRFPKQRILVLGDIILDHYLRGSVTRTSPEAPVPILAVEDEEWLPGGAANVANNIVTLGGRVDLVGLVGKDEGADRLRQIFAGIKGIKATLHAEGDRPTILKSRAMAQGQQMLRLDRERVAPASEPTYRRVLDAIQKGLSTATWSGIILSDYGKGFLQPAFIQEVVKLARGASIPVFVDPKGRDYARYRGVTVLTPNQKEASEATGIAVHDDASAAEAARLLQKMVQGDAVVITRGASGVSVFPKKGSPAHLPAQAREVYDVTGAGDTFLSVLALASFSGASWSEAAQLANLAAGIVVGQVGVACVSLESLRSACQQSGSGFRRKIVSAPELEQSCRSLRAHGSRIVFTNGFFDLLHQGHIRLLEQARGFGDALIVALNSDESTRRLKGAPRPILGFKERAEMLSAFPFVDFVIGFEEDTPESLLKLLKPEILVKGTVPGTPTEVVGRSIVEAYGGSVRLVDLGAAMSISQILSRAIHPEQQSPKQRKAKRP